MLRSLEYWALVHAIKVFDGLRRVVPGAKR
jgi:hypothetical protein